MNAISGVICDKRGQAIPNAKVALLTDRFEVIVEAFADENGVYRLEAEPKKYTYFIASKGFEYHFLEFWAYNLDLSKDIVLNPKLDKIEVFSLIFFPSLDIDNTMMIFFRPMSLQGFLNKEKTIAPNLDIEDIALSINGISYQIVNMRVATETVTIGVNPLKGYALKVDISGIEFDGSNRLELSIIDKNGDYGEAVLFF